MPAEFPEFCDERTFIGLMKQVAIIKLDNLNGQRLQTPPAKGLYIENGRVVMRRQTGGRR